MSARPPVSVVVPTRDRPDRVATCVAAVRRALRDGDEVVVVDSASRVPLGPQNGARVVRVDVPGASRARNAGWRATTHELVLFTDDDCLPEPGWADALAAALADPAVGFAWGRVVAAVPGTGTADHDVGGPMRAVPGDDAAPLGGAGNLAVKRPLLERTGGYDELLGPGEPLRAAEDKDLLARLLREGATGVFAVDAVVEHEVWRGRWELLRLQHHYGIGAGALGAKLRREGGDVSALFSGGQLRTHLRLAASYVRTGYQTGVAHALAQATGVARGRWAARRLTVVDGRFERRSSAPAAREHDEPA
jgi:glycosyltransferase involved in cell wall biosynthesis